MAAFIESGRVFDLILLIMALEIAAILIFGRARTGLPLRDGVSMVLPGAGLVAAARAVTLDAHWTVIAACLLFSLAAHLYDIANRRAAAKARGSAPRL